MSKIKLSDHFTFRRILLAVLPSITMMVFRPFTALLTAFSLLNLSEQTLFPASILPGLLLRFFGLSDL